MNIFYVKKLILVLISLFVIQLIYGKNNVDSLITELDKSTGEEKVDILLNIGKYYCQNETKKAIVYCNQALTLSNKLSYVHGKYAAYNTLAISYERLFDYEKSLKNYQKALALADQVRKKNSRARIYNNIGNTYDLLEEQNKAIKHYHMGLNTLDTTELQLQVMLNLNMGAAYGDINQYDSTMFYFKRALDIAQRPDFENDNLQLILMANIAELYSLMGNTNEALNQARMAKEMLTPENNLHTHASIMHVCAGIYLKNNKLKEAERAIHQVIKLADKLNNTKYKMTALERMAVIHKKRGEFSEAVAYYEAYNQLKDSSLSAEKNKRIVEFEAKYEAEKKQNEIEQLKNEKALNDLAMSKLRMRNTLITSFFVVALVVIIFTYRGYRYKKRTNNKLKQMNVALQSAKKDLEKSIIVKDNLIKVIGHDLKGPIGSISGFSELILENINETAQEVINKYTKLILQISGSTLTLLDNILYWANLQQEQYSINKRDFKCLEATKKAINPYLGIADRKEIDINLNIQNDDMAYGDTFAYGIIMQNLVNNALKFTPKGGVITIKSQQQSNGVTFSVEDSGIGIEEEIAKDLFSDHKFNTSKGTDNEPGTGFGLKICKEFVELNNGKIWFESRKGSGTVFFFHFPSK